MTSKAPNALKEAVDAIERAFRELATTPHAVEKTLDIRLDEPAQSGHLDDTLPTDERRGEELREVRHLQRVFDELDEELRALVRETKKEGEEGRAQGGENDDATEAMDAETAFKLLFGSKD